MNDTTATVDVEQAGHEPAEAVSKVDAVVPKTVAGQKHIPPAGRHSKQTHRRAAARAEALGLSTTRELYDHDRAEVLAKLQKGADGAVAQQRNEQNRRSGAGAEKT